MSVNVQPLRWWRRFPDAFDDSAAAWVTSMAEAAFDPIRPEPDAGDLLDARVHAPAERAGFLIRRGLLRCLAARHLGLPSERVGIAYDPTGAPRLRTPHEDAFVSTASRQGYLALAVASRPIGVDIECGEGDPEPAWAMLGDAERRMLERLPAPARWATFLRIWTAKEAYLKALGTGLTREPRAIAVALLGAENFALKDRESRVGVVAARHRTVIVDHVRLTAACVILAGPPPHLKSTPI